MQTKTNYIEGTTLQLDLWGDHFASLEEKAEGALARGRASIVNKLRTLRRKKRTLKRRLREAAHNSSKADWESARGELEEAVSDFRALAAEVYDDVQRV